MGLKAIYCENVLEPKTAKSGASASASSDFSGKDLLTYAGMMTAMAAVAGCVSSYQNDNAVAETNKTEVRHSASGEGKPSPDVTTTPVTEQAQHNATARGNDELPYSVARVANGKDYSVPFNDLQGDSIFDQWRNFEYPGSIHSTTHYGKIVEPEGTYIFEFQGVGHKGDTDIAHFDVYFSSMHLQGGSAGEDTVVKTRHIDLYEDFQPDWNQYKQIINSTEDTTHGPIAVLNFQGNDQYDFKLVARVSHMWYEYPNSNRLDGADLATLQVNAFPVQRNK